MGDTGSMAIGGALAALRDHDQDRAAAAPDRRDLPDRGALGDPPGLHASSTWGRRIFLMAPIHHHFEMKAWSETKIMVRFWILGGDLLRLGVRRSTTASSDFLPPEVQAGARPRARALGEAAALALRSAAWRSSASTATPAIDAGRLAAAGVEVRLGTDEGAAGRCRVCWSRALACRRRRRRSRARASAASRSGARSSSAVRLLAPRPFVGVTGTNGKTTTTELLGAMFRAAGRPVEVAGNVGRALDLASRALRRRPGSSASSRRSSSRTWRARARGGAPAQPRARPPRPARHLRGATATRSSGIFERQRAEDGRRAARFGRTGGRPSSSPPTTRCPPSRAPGAHNRENAAAATVAARAAGLADDAIAEALRTFRWRSAPARARRASAAASARSTTRSRPTLRRARRHRRLRRAAAPDPRRPRKGEDYGPFAATLPRTSSPSTCRRARPTSSRGARRRRQARTRGRDARRAPSPPPPRRPGRRRRAALAGCASFDQYPSYERARRGLPPPRGGARMKRGQVESTLLILVTLGLVAFGLVMVYSATSAPATLGGGDPGYYLKSRPSTRSSASGCWSARRASTTGGSRTLVAAARRQRRLPLPRRARHGRLA